MGKNQSFFRVRNWDQFQHYKDRSPPWIKLYNSILDDYSYAQLSDAGKGHLFAIWLLASRSANKLPWDEKWIASRIQAKTRVDLEELERLGFINRYDDRSNMLASCKQNACLETETETEEERETEPPIVPLEKGDGLVQEIFDYWRSCLNHPKAILDAKREKAIRARLKEGYTVERIKAAIDGIQRSPHHMGQNDRQTVYDDIELICRSGTNVDKFADMALGEAPEVLGAKRRMASYLIGDYDHDQK